MPQVASLLSVLGALLGVCASKTPQLSDAFESNFVWRSAYVAPWQTMPPLSPMPTVNLNGTVQVNGIELWYAMYGAELHDSQAEGYSPVIFLHGGFANSDYYSHQINSLRDGPYTLITIDSRGHGRSTDDTSRPITYDLMTLDVLALMDWLRIERFSVVGWSDGGCISFNLAMNNSERIDRVLSFGGTYNVANMNTTALDSYTFKTYMEWVREDYKRLSPTTSPFEEFEERMMHMWLTEPVWNADSFQQIPSRFDNPDAPMIWIVAADSEEAVTRNTPGDLYNWVSICSRTHDHCFDHSC